MKLIPCKGHAWQVPIPLRYENSNGLRTSSLGHLKSGFREKTCRYGNDENIDILKVINFAKNQNQKKFKKLRIPQFKLIVYKQRNSKI